VILNTIAAVILFFANIYQGIPSRQALLANGEGGVVVVVVVYTMVSIEYVKGEKKIPFKWYPPPNY